MSEEFIKVTDGRTEPLPELLVGAKNKIKLKYEQLTKTLEVLVIFVPGFTM